MNYDNNTLTRLVGVIASRPGLTTKQLFEQVGAHTGGEQSFIRGELKRLTKRKTLSREKRPSTLGGAPTFAYFPGERMQPTMATGHVTAPPTITVQPTTTRRQKPTKNDWAALGGVALDTIVQAATGIETAEVARKMNKTTPNEKVLVRRLLDGLVVKGKVIRCVGKRAGARGYPPYVYFPNTPDGRLAKKQFAELNGTPNTLAGKATSIRDKRTTKTNGTTPPMVEQVFRIQMPSGNTEELTADTARQLYESLGTLFA